MMYKIKLHKMVGGIWLKLQKRIDGIWSEGTKQILKIIFPQIRVNAGNFRIVNYA
jgi:mRNA-degrading endonuclease RelE of RelBE toxin-antitoxin system